MVVDPCDIFYVYKQEAIMEIFRGCGVAMITPMNEDYSVDFDAFRNLCEVYIREGVAALIVNGTTGESPTLTQEEILQLVKIAVEVSNKRVPIIVGTGSNDTQHVLELSLEVEKEDIDGFLIVTPYYNKTTQLGLINHYTYLADNLHKPMILYAVPSRTNLKFEVNTLLELAKHPNIIGLKDAVGDMHYTMKVMSKLKESNVDFHLYSGEDWNIFQYLTTGGSGVVSVVGNLYPRITQEYCQLIFNGEIEKARQLALDLEEVNDCLFMDCSPMNIKTAVASKGLCKDVLRRPLIPTGDRNKEILLEAMQRFEEKEY